MDVPETRWARTVDGACIAYQDFGEGPSTLVFVQGWISHLEVDWELPRLRSRAEAPREDMRVLALRQARRRHVGPSRRAHRVSTSQMDDIRAVMDAAGVERAALFGAGWIGPAMAAFFAATHPDRTLALWLDGPVHYAQDADYPWGESRRGVGGAGSAPSAPTGATTTTRSTCGARLLRRQPRGRARTTTPPSCAGWRSWRATPPPRPASSSFGSMWRETDIAAVLPDDLRARPLSSPSAVGDDAREEQPRAEYVAGAHPGCARSSRWTGATMLHLGSIRSAYVAASRRFIALSP